MSILSLTNVALAFGANDVLHGISVELNPGARIGLVGTNGAGKTTLLHILAGTLEPTGGQRAVARGVRTGLVEQVSSVAGPTDSVLDEARSAIHDLLQMEHDLEKAAHRLGTDPKADQHYAHLLNQFEARGGFNYPSRIKQILTGVGFDEPEWGKPVAALSGGQRGRLALAQGLLAEPDVLLMDEPTNHLDLAGLSWLESFIARWRGALVVTSHDRYFLDTVAAGIWLLEGGALTTYSGNYSRFEILRVAELADLEKRYEAQQAYIAREEAFIRRYGAGQRAREARGRAQKLSHVDRIEAPSERATVNVKLGAARSGDIALSARALAVGYGDRTIVDVGKLEVLRGQRIAVVGPNGSGKSTLLQTLAGELPPTDGSLSLGSRVQAELYHQEAGNLDGDATPLEEILATGKVDAQQARDFLGRFLFSGDDVSKRVGQLSGGERGRLAIAKLVLAGANLLLLDEPTNHLDIASREALEEALSAFPGTLVFASHDRRLISRLATRVWVVSDGRLTQLDGGFAEYERTLRATPSAPAARVQRTSASQPGAASTATQTARKIAGIEARIEGIEGLLGTLGAQIEEAAQHRDLDTITELGHRFEESRAELDALMEEWAVLIDAG